MSDSLCERGYHRNVKIVCIENEDGKTLIKFICFVCGQIFKTITAKDEQ